MMRSQYCGEVTKTFIGESVTLAGWVYRRRDHGGVIFIDLRDRTGIVQVVVAPNESKAFTEANLVRNEFVIQVKGDVRARPEGTVNTEIATGEIEVVAKELIILNRSEPLPFSLDEFHEVGEELRLRYRYLDIRRPEMFNRLQFRANVFRTLRQFLDENGFLEVETPFLTRATPEGARDYVVPSRTYPGSFFALPQSPQQFKQILMMSGIDRYYQIVKCFRDEDLRADRQPEFTQLDIETSFLNEHEIQTLMECMMQGLFADVLNVKLTSPFLRLPYEEAMHRYGSDKPDLRIPLELVEVSDLFKDVAFKIFSAAAKDAHSRVAALHIPGGASLSRKEIDDYTQYVSIFGARGLAYIKITGPGKEGLQSPILKFLGDEVIDALLARLSAKEGDIIFFGADKKTIVNESLGALRLKVGHDLKLIEEGWKILWIIDFPMFEQKEGRLTACHHPFTAPQTESIETLKQNPQQCLARAYDLVLNGSEIGGGSIRIHSSDMQKAVFNLLQIPDEEAEDKFGPLLTAMKLGCPPHGGIAFGLDRIVMLMTGASSIRDVIAFPKTQTASCPLMEAPSRVPVEQLVELGIQVKVKTRE